MSEDRGRALQRAQHGTQPTEGTVYALGLVCSKAAEAGNGGEEKRGGEGRPSAGWSQGASCGRGRGGIGKSCRPRSALRSRGHCRGQPERYVWSASGPGVALLLWERTLAEVICPHVSSAPHPSTLPPSKRCLNSGALTWASSGLETCRGQRLVVLTCLYSHRG